jgi:hypothetical protein
VLWSFGAIGGDGDSPIAGLIADRWGNLYGTTNFGGTNPCFFGCGTLFEVSPPASQSSQWQEQVLWDFGADDDGRNPAGDLLSDRWGNFFSTTFYGGANGKNGDGVSRFCGNGFGLIGCGTVFEFKRN